MKQVQAKAIEKLEMFTECDINTTSFGQQIDQCTVNVIIMGPLLNSVQSACFSTKLLPWEWDSHERADLCKKCDRALQSTPKPSVIQTTRHTLPMPLLCFAPGTGCALLCPELCFDSMATQAGRLKAAQGVAQRLQLGELSSRPSKKGPFGWVHAAAQNRRRS